jgi:hypothetical protein
MEDLHRQSVEVFLSVRESLLGVLQIKKLCMGIDT